MKPHPPDGEDELEEFATSNPLWILTEDGVEQLTPMECPLCNKEWTAQHPPEAIELECPGCGYMVDRTDHEII